MKDKNCRGGGNEQENHITGRGNDLGDDDRERRKQRRVEKLIGPPLPLS